MTDLEWKNETRKLSELIPWEMNPKIIRKEDAQRLGESLDEFGQVMPFAIGPDNQIYDGHQRHKVWGLADRFGPDFEVDVRVSNRPLTDAEKKKLTVLLEKASGEWDWDILANHFDQDDLMEWGFSEAELGFDYDVDLDFEPEPSENKGFRQMKFTLLPDQFDMVDDVLESIVSAGIDIPDNPHELSNALFHLANYYYQNMDMDGEGSDA